MPTGYTAGIADGTVTDLRTFALGCARAMGALIMMRDEPMDAPIPERFDPSDYHAKERDKALERMKALKAMTSQDIEKASADWNAENEQFKLKRIRNNEDQRERYDQMISETEAWEGAPEGLKEFMLEQLQKSREFDVSDDPTRFCEPYLCPADWYAKQCKAAAWDVEYHSRGDADEKRRTEERNAWLAQLRASLPAE